MVGHSSAIKHARATGADGSLDDEASVCLFASKAKTGTAEERRIREEGSSNNVRGEEDSRGKKDNRGRQQQ
jgi:hypothetical protein